MQKEDNHDMSVNKAKTEPEEHSGITRSHGNRCLALIGTHIGLSPLPSLIASLIQVTCWGALHEPDGEFREAERGTARSWRRHCSPSPIPTLHAGPWQQCDHQTRAIQCELQQHLSLLPPSIETRRQQHLHLPNLTRVSLIAKLNPEPYKERNSEKFKEKSSRKCSFNLGNVIQIPGGQQSADPNACLSSFEQSLNV